MNDDDEVMESSFAQQQFEEIRRYQSGLIIIIIQRIKSFFSALALEDWKMKKILGEREKWRENENLKLSTVLPKNLNEH